MVRPLEVDGEEVGHEVVEQVEQVGRPLGVMSEQREVVLGVLITVVTVPLQCKALTYAASGSMGSIRSM